MKSTLQRPSTQFLLVLILYLVLLLPTVPRQGISWDEQTDQNVTLAYLTRPGGWLTGSDIDASQTRLPMFIVGAVYALFGTTDLLAARLVSVLAGGLTLLGVFKYNKEHFGGFAAVIASTLLATSPFFLSFARVAYTETDVFLACALTWLLYSLSRFQAQPNLGRAAVTGVLLGLALSAKFTALALLPGIWFVVYRSGSNRGEGNHDRRTTLRAVIFSLWMAACLVAGPTVAGLVTQAGPSPWLALLFALLALSWAITLAWAAANQGNRANPIALAAFITTLGMLTFLVIPPEHLGNPGILRALFERADREMTFNLAFSAEAAALHLLSLFIKSSPLAGAGSLIGGLAAAWQWRRPEIRNPLLLTGLYFAGLLALPIAQTFYSIPILPLVAILAAERFSALALRRRVFALALGSLALLGLVVDLTLCYPDFNLNGYQYLGARPLAGRASIGYRSVVQTPSDGVEQAFHWLNQHATPRQRVLAYLTEWHIVQATAPTPLYTILDGFREPLYPLPDFIVIHINATIWQGWGTDTPTVEVIRPPLDPTWLAEYYQPVHTVPRRFGLQMATVWERRQTGENIEGSDCDHCAKR